MVILYWNSGIKVKETIRDSRVVTKEEDKKGGFLYSKCFIY